MMDVGGRAGRFAGIVRTLQPACLIDGRLGAAGDYVSTDDNVIPAGFSDESWEIPATINHTWGYRADDNDWKRPGEIIFKLVDITSKGGNYLLNNGPKADGSMPEPCVEILRTVGAWLKVNGDAIYGAQRTPFGEELGGPVAGLADRRGNPVWGERAEWRCTARPGRLYFTVFPGWPREGFDLPAFKNKIKTAYHLDDPSGTPVEIITGADGIRTAKVARPPRTAVANVLVVEYEGGAIDR
jgi:alpha-L-fucosidase